MLSQVCLQHGHDVYHDVLALLRGGVEALSEYSQTSICKGRHQFGIITHEYLTLHEQHGGKKIRSKHSIIITKQG